MITIEQCRAARGLLGWTQQDLADACGLSKTAINNFEKSHSDIKYESLKAIRMAFESANVEFIAQEGVRKKTDHVQTLRGPDAFNNLLGDIYETLRESGGEILINNVNERTISQITTERLKDHLKQQHAAKITARALCAQNETTPLVDSKNIRTLPQIPEALAMPTILYGDKVAFELWERTMIIIVNSPDAYDAERRRFEMLWSLSEDSSAQNKTASA